MNIGEYLLLFGPNRRSERTIIEQQVMLTGAERDMLSSRLRLLFGRLVSTLNALAVPTGPWLSAEGIETADVPGSFARLLTGTALALQSSAGHRVNEQGFVLDSAGQGVWAWFEYEHDEVGERASTLALGLLAELEPALQWEAEEGAAGADFPSRYRQFLEFARPLVLPADTEAILAAARRANVPGIKLDRNPYKGVKGDFRIRLNGLCTLGHCGYQQLIDGTFCLTRNADLLTLLGDREALRQKCLQMQVPVPAHADDAGNCVVTKRAIRAAQQLGYPVAVKPGKRLHGKGVTLNVRTAQELREAVEQARRIAPQVNVEAMVPGSGYQILVANHKVLGVICCRAGSAL